MKKTKKIYSLLLLTSLLWLPALLHADDHLQKAQKTVVKKIAVTKNMQLSVNNQYGDVVVQSWKQNSAVIRVTIIGQSSKLSRANTLIGFVKFKTSKVPGVYSIETVIDTASQHINSSSGEECHISYQVFVPGNLKLSVTNHFGDIHVKGFDGDLEIDEKFGNLKIEQSSGPFNINVEQGNADIDRIHDGSLKFKGFNTVRIGELSGAVDAKFWSGGRVDLGLSGDLQKLGINAANVNPLNITNLKPANANVKVHSTVSKIIYNGQMLVRLEKKLNLSTEKPAKTDTVFIVGKGDTAQKSKLKLLDIKKISVTAMKTVDYTLKTGSATTDIKIDVSFCVVDLKD